MDNIEAKIDENRDKQNEIPKALVGNCKPHTIFTATKKHLLTGKQFFPPTAINFFVDRTPNFPTPASMQTDGFKSSAFGGKMGYPARSFCQI